MKAFQRHFGTIFFGEVTAQTLSGKKVPVEGTLVGAVLVATKIKR